MFYFKEIYNFTRFRGGGGGGGGGGGSNLFQGVKLLSRGVQMLILETHRTCDFLGGGVDPLSPSGSAHVTI